jgi:hypothetical protein
VTHAYYMRVSVLDECALLAASLCWCGRDGEGSQPSVLAALGVVWC